MSVLTSTAHQITDTDTVAPARPRVAPVLRAGLLSGTVAAVLLVAYGAALDGAGVTMRAKTFGSAHMQAITPASFAFGVACSVLWGTLIAAALCRYAKRPAQTFARTAAVLLALSFVSPLTAHASTATTLALCGGHLIAAAVVIPSLVRALRRTR